LTSIRDWITVSIIDFYTGKDELGQTTLNLIGTGFNIISSQVRCTIVSKGKEYDAESMAVTISSDPDQSVMLGNFTFEMDAEPETVIFYSEYDAINRKRIDCKPVEN
jgi:hypothetical protein